MLGSCHVGVGIEPRSGRAVSVPDPEPSSLSSGMAPASVTLGHTQGHTQSHGSVGKAVVGRKSLMAEAGV